MGVQAEGSQAGGQEAGSGGWAGPEGCLDSVLRIARGYDLGRSGPFRDQCRSGVEGVVTLTRIKTFKLPNPAALPSYPAC